MSFPTPRRTSCPDFQSKVALTTLSQLSFHGNLRSANASQLTPTDGGDGRGCAWAARGTRENTASRCFSLFRPHPRHSSRSSSQEQEGASLSLARLSSAVSSKALQSDALYRVASLSEPSIPEHECRLAELGLQSASINTNRCNGYVKAAVKR